MPEQPSVALMSTPSAVSATPSPLPYNAADSSTIQGASPTGVSNAPSLPTSLPSPANYPPLDKTPPT